MSKGAIGLTAGFWPDDIHRYLAIPGLSLDDGLVSRPGKRHPDHPAILSYEGIITYKQLSVDMDRYMKAILSRTDGNSARVAIAMRQPLDLVRVTFGALKGRCTIFLTDPSSPVDKLKTHLDQFAPHWILTDDSEFKKKVESLGQETPIVSFPDLEGNGATFAQPRSRLDLQAPAIALSTEAGRLVYHSHKSLLAGAVSWSSFLPLKAEDMMLGLQPLSQWEGLYALLPILFRGGSCFLADLDDPERLARSVLEHPPCFTILPRMEARRLYDSSYWPLVRAFRDTLRGLFVSVTGPFTALGRRRLRGLLNKPALLTYGAAELGPVFSSHPTWYLDAAVGMPITNVDVWPLNPENGNPLEVPWETVEYGEVGVKSPMTAVGYQTAEDQERYVHGGWVRTKVIATMDPNGLYYIQSNVAN